MVFVYYSSDMPIFGDADHPSVSLRLHNMQRPINILTGMKRSLLFQHLFFQKIR